MDNYYAVDQAFIVSVRALKRILKRISSTNDRNWWWIMKETQYFVTVAQGPLLGFPERSFRFPKVAHIKLFGEDGEMVCMHPYTSGVVQRSMRVHDGRLKYAEDWEPFWSPIKVAIRKEGQCQGALAVIRRKGREAR